ncbi:hypothetical protein Rhe02_54730 [Rhizocola hellebori]|uniref:Helix-turn-helix domain-containing protein n=1 Tax=Rhizocola hellebori TaxID=1392758 RepID=A0A8J3VIT8_9ACTN|nr:helix-turn-helix domain-containing protein [Rhizocola hellebori]GIH07406.1 hypothetical protein Rhe02_54730 [Rhizocola hellebori]
MDLQRRLTIAEAADYFDLPKGTISRWYTLGHLPHTIKQGRVRLYLFEDLVDAECKTRNSPNSRRASARPIAA